MDRYVTTYVYTYAYIYLVNRAGADCCKERCPDYRHSLGVKNDTCHKDIDIDI